MRFECMRTVFSEITSSSAMRTTVLPRTMCSMTSASRALRRNSWQMRAACLEMRSW